jgi:hypothetical protein
MLSGGTRANSFRVMDGFAGNRQVAAWVLCAPVLAFLSCRLIGIADSTYITKENGVTRLHDRTNQGRSFLDFDLMNLNFSIVSLSLAGTLV